jgi:signal transduction histidine kinase
MAELASQDGGILVVEDDVDLRESLIEVLRAQGYRAQGAENGARALAYLAACRIPPELILLDLMMPEMDGWRFRVEQKKRPTLATTPVIVLTADESPQAAAIDADAVIQKPFETAALLAAIRASLEKVREERAARAERLMSLGTLLAGLTHEINNPLTYLTTNLEYLDDRLDEAVRDEYRSELEPLVKDALEGARRIRVVVEQVHELNRSQRKRAVVSVQSACESATKLVFNLIRHRARFVKNFVPTLRVLANENQLVQIVVNLLVNAVHAVPEGAVEQNEIRLATGHERPGWVYIEVRDTGSGMPDDVRRRIVEPFFTTNPDDAGGLDLPIAYGIVRNWGGDIFIDSDVGRPTAVRVVLPEAFEDLATTDLPPRRAAVRRARLLIIDDEPAILRALTRILNDLDVVTAGSGSQALALLEADAEFDVLLCDLMMPDMTGADLFEAVSAKHRSLSERFVFMTGGAFSSSTEQFLQELEAPFLSKPIDPTALRRLIADRLARAAS